jgi:uncharacterized protein
VAQKAAVKARANSGITPQYVAAARCCKKVAELLIVSKADVNLKARLGLTPLHAAAFGGHKETAELLLANGANNRGRIQISSIVCIALALRQT